MDALPLILFTLSLIALTTTISATNITDVLSAYPEYSNFNNYLTQTKLADEINTRQTITVFALNNAALSLHVLLDYYDNKELHDISDGTVLSTTLYQTTGNAQASDLLNLKAGQRVVDVGFGVGGSMRTTEDVYDNGIVMMTGLREKRKLKIWMWF